MKDLGKVLLALAKLFLYFVNAKKLERMKRAKRIQDLGHALANDNTESMARLRKKR